jgi:hypothetical protein
MRSIYKIAVAAARAQRIVAEILFYREAVKKIAADSLFFLPAERAKKCAQIPN